MSVVSVTSKGQVTIPKHIRQELGIATGSKVQFELAGGIARLRVAPKGHTSRIEDGPAILAYTGPRISIGDMQGDVAAKRSAHHACR